MRRFLNFGKAEYKAPQVAPLPEDQSKRGNAVYINESQRCFRLDIFDRGMPGDIEMALGSLEMAKGVILQTMGAWHAKEQARKAILIPRSNGHG